MSELQERLNRLKEWWARLAVREQRTVAIGGGALGLFLFYQIIWSPILSHIDTMRKHIATAHRTLAWMQSEDAQIKTIETQAGSQNRAATSPVVLLSYLQKQLEQSGLAPAVNDLKQSSNDSVEMHFQKVSFDRLMALLAAVIKEQPVSIEQMAVIADPSPGMVKADIVLKLE